MLRTKLHLVVLAALCCVASFASGQTAIGTSQTIRADKTVKIVPSAPIDTNDLRPKIVQTFAPQRPEPENPYRPASWITATPPNNLAIGGMLKEKRHARSAKWPAINATGWVPPDVTLGVGPNNVVVTVNSSVAFFTRAGVKQLEQTFDTFFSGMGAGSFLYDPKVFYDRLSNRFFIVVLEEDDASQTSKLLIAVSDDNDPNGTWFRYRVEAKWSNGGNTYWFDYPGFGYNKDAIVMTGNMFTFSNGNFGGVQFQVIPKAPLLTGAAATMSVLHDTNAFTMQMAEIGDNTVNALFGISDFNSTNVKACAITNVTTSPTLTSWFVTVPTVTYSTNYSVSTSRSLDPVANRHLCANFRSGHVLTSCTVRGASNIANRVRWYDFDFSGSPTSAPTLAQSGELASPNAGESYFMGAINKNAFGDISAIYTRSSSSIPADIVYSARFSTDPAGTMGSPVLLKSAEGANYGSAGINRWGDYFQVNVDPTDDNTFWGVAMTGDSAGNWRTHVYNWALLIPLQSVTTTTSTVVAGTSSTGTATLTQNARPGGSVVTLSSSDSHLTVPASVNVANGASSAPFSFTTTAVASSTNVTITAVSGGVTKTTTVTLSPATAVSGSVTLQDFVGTVTGTQVKVELRTPGTTTVVATYNATLDASGNYTFNAAQNGTFDVTVKASHWLKTKVANVVISGSSSSVSAVSLINGDVDGNNTVNTADQTALTIAFRSKPASANWNANADLNGDGQVSASDQAILGKNFNKTGA